MFKVGDAVRVVYQEGYSSFGIDVAYLRSLHGQVFKVSYAEGQDVQLNNGDKLWYPSYMLEKVEVNHEV